MSTLPADLSRQLAALAVRALVDDVPARIDRAAVELAGRVPGAVAVGLFDISDAGLVLAAGERWDQRPGSDGPVDAVVPALVAGTGVDDTRIAARSGEREILTVGRAGRRHLALITVVDDREAPPDHAALALLADVAQVAAVASHRSQVEEQLRTSQERLNEAQHLGRMGSYDWHIASDTNLWSDELYRIYGTEPQSFNASYERFLQFVHPDDREKVKAVHAKAYEEGGSYEMEERIVRPDGEVRILETTGQVIVGPDGAPERMVGVCLDVTERRREQQQVTEMALALHDASTRRRQALEINDGVVQGLASVIYTLEAGDAQLALEAARRTMQVARSMMHDLMRGSSDEDLEAETLVRASAPISVLGAPPDAVEPQPPTQAPTGAVRALVVDDADDLRMLLTIAVSSREGYEVVGEAADGAEAIELAEQLRPDVILLDLAMPVMDGFEALPRLREMLPDAVIVVLSGFDADRMERRAVELGADRYVEKGTSSSKLLALLDDLTDRPEPATIPPDPATPAPDDLGVQKLSHELRTPLTVIRSMIDTLHDQMDALPAAAVREILTAAARNADVMTGLIDSVSALQRLGTGDFVVAVERTDLGALVEEHVADIRGITANHRIEIRVSEAVHAPVDPLRVRQVLTNLLSNAAKYAPQGSRIDVVLERREDVAVLRVRDEGPGVSAEREEELFRRFSRLGAEGSGMGLGLYISRAIAQAHGGDLRLERTERHEVVGASFVLELPLARATRPVSPA